MSSTGKKSPNRVTGAKPAAESAPATQEEPTKPPARLPRHLRPPKVYTNIRKPKPLVPDGRHKGRCRDLKRTGPPNGKCHANHKYGGKPCMARAARGSYVCFRHGGGAPQVRRKAAQRVVDMLAEAMDPKRILREAGRLALSDIRELFDDSGNMLPVKKWPDDIARAVSSVEVLKRNVIAGDGALDDVLKIRLWDKTSKLANLMKYHGQLAEKLDVSVKIDVVQKLEAGRKRVAEARQALLESGHAPEMREATVIDVVPEAATSDADSDGDSDPE